MLNNAHTKKFMQSVHINEKLMDSSTCIPRILPNFWFHISHIQTHTIPSTLHHGTHNEIFQALFPLMGILQPKSWGEAWEQGYISLSTLVWLLQEVDFLDILLDYFSKQSTNLTNAARTFCEQQNFGIQWSVNKTSGSVCVHIQNKQ